MEAFSHGRTESVLEAPFHGERLLFAGMQFDGREIKDARYNHCTFSNVSFLKAIIQSAQFRDCVFIECYFRKTDFRGSTFVGCKFINCNFSHATISSCDFRYADFRGTHPPYNEMKYSSPSEPNLKRDLWAKLSSAAEVAGDLEEARRYRLGSITAQNEHLWAAVRADSTWYGEHYKGSRRVAAAGQLLWHHLNRILWQHGESAWRLLINAVVVATCLFPLLFLLNRNGLATADFRTGPVDVLWLSLSNFALIDRVSDVELVSSMTRGLATAEGLLGVIFAGMYVTLLVKALLRR